MDTVTDLMKLGQDGVIDIDWAKLLRSDVSDLSVDEQFVAVSILDAGLKAFGSRLEDLKTSVRDLAEDLEPGTSTTVEGGGVKILLTAKRPTVKVNETALLVLLRNRMLDPEEVCFRRVEVMQLDTVRLEQAIAGKVFNDDEIKQFTEEGKVPAPSVQVKEYALGVTSKRLLGDR